MTLALIIIIIIIITVRARPRRPSVDVPRARTTARVSFSSSLVRSRVVVVVVVVGRSSSSVVVVPRCQRRGTDARASPFGRSRDRSDRVRRPRGMATVAVRASVSARGARRESNERMTDES